MLRPWKLGTMLSPFLITACIFGPAPGKGGKADRGYRLSAPVIEALTQFRKDSAYYPDSLSHLAPRYLPAAALEPPQGWTAQNWPRYQSKGTSFVLSFWYSGPGSNTCYYSSQASVWQCHSSY
jgi:hypothetical protein